MVDTAVATLMLAVGLTFLCLSVTVAYLGSAFHIKRCWVCRAVAERGLGPWGWKDWYSQRASRRQK